MKKLRILFAVTSVLFLVVLAIAPFKDYFRNWKHYQYEYNKLVATLPQRVKPTEIGIKQIWVQKLNRVDRCVTCHLGINEPALRNAPQPFRTHPKVYHDIEEYGCTSCHEGQGAATDFKDAHGQGGYWDRPMLPAKYMEASCGTCHKQEDVRYAPTLSRGRKLLTEYNCVGCHQIEGRTKSWVPPLDGIGSKVSRAWLFNWLKNPKSYWDHSRMPNFMLSDSDANNLADFLLTFKASPDSGGLEPLPAALANPTPASEKTLEDLGATKFAEARCVTCHTVNGKGGYIATDLGKIASKTTPDWLYNYIKSPKHVMAGVMMPRFRFTDQELMGVVAYIKANFVDYDMKQPPDHTPDPDAYQKGLAVFKRSNCSGCHQLANFQADEMGPDLTNVGSKRAYEIEFGPAKIEHSLPEYIRTKLLDPRIFSHAMKMPNFQFSKQDAEAITVALLANKRTNDPASPEYVPANFMQLPAPRHEQLPQGEFGKLVNDLSCLACHKMEGNGRLVATDLSIEASQARPEWIANYFKVPYSLRPILTERMPKLYLSDAEIKTIVDYMEMRFVADSIDRIVVPTDDALVSTGRGLYFERFACQSCHQLGGKGGYVGPPLDNVGTRLRPGWIYSWLKNPRAFKPTTIEPDNKLNERDADALTAFLLTQKQQKP